MLPKVLQGLPIRAGAVKSATAERLIVAVGTPSARPKLLLIVLLDGDPQLAGLAAPALTTTEVVAVLPKPFWLALDRAVARAAVRSPGM